MFRDVVLIYETQKVNLQILWAVFKIDADLAFMHGGWGIRGRESYCPEIKLNHTRSTVWSFSLCAEKGIRGTFRDSSTTLLPFHHFTGSVPFATYWTTHPFSPTTPVLTTFPLATKGKATLVLSLLTFPPNRDANSLSIWSNHSLVLLPI